MGTTLAELDAVQNDVVKAFYQSVPLSAWQSATMYCKYAPGGTGALDFDFVLPDGSLVKNAIPDAPSRAQLYALTQRHLELTKALSQPAWYKMTVTVERSGQFKVDFGYQENYSEGEVMQRG